MSPRKIATFAIGPIGGAFLSLITLPIITWYFSQEDVGKLSMLLVTINASTLLFSLGLDQAYVREFHEVSDKPALLKKAISPGLLLLSATLILFLSLDGVLAEWVFDIPQWRLSFLIAIVLWATFISRFLSLVLRMNERGLAYSLSQMLPKLMLLGIIVLYVIAGADKNLFNLVLANAFVFVSVCLIFAFNVRHELVASIGSKVNAQHLKGMLKFGAPLIIGGLAFWGLTAIDKVFLRMLTNFEELGIYSVSVSFAGAATILQSVFSTVWAPIVYKWASEGRNLYIIDKVTRYMLAVVVAAFCLTGLFSWVVLLFIPQEYAPVRWIVVSCLAYPLLYTLSETTVVGIAISRRSGFAMLAALVAFAFNILGNYMLIPLYGAAGAAVSTCIAFMIFFILRTEFSIYLWRPVPRKLLYSYTLLSVVSAVVFTLWGEEVVNWMNFFWSLMLISLVFLFNSELREVREYFNKSRRR